MIGFDGFSFWYPGATGPTLRDVDLTVGRGRAGASGRPHRCRQVDAAARGERAGAALHRRTRRGRVTLGGLDPRDSAAARVRRTSSVWSARTRCRASSPTRSRRSSPTAWSSSAIEPQVMRRRVEEMLDLMGIAHLRRRALRTLSGGEQQRVALGSVLTSHPQMLVLDEPTSALDPTAAEDALPPSLRLVHDLGVTVRRAEHRLERVVEYADRLVVRRRATGASRRPAGDCCATHHWRRRSSSWAGSPAGTRCRCRYAMPADGAGALRERIGCAGRPRSDAATRRAGAGRRERRRAVRRQGRGARGRPRCAPGEVVALMGRNGSGKSSLLWALQGAGRRSGGSRRWPARTLRRRRGGHAAARIALVPQTGDRPAVPRLGGRRVRRGRP